ncbi:MAG: hypothetical protein BWK73_19940 [Thiothrix lacustris]|uniref:Response regulatory domain-containing protein n=1 Tax=Thiothrix lacustris TaxID=525917 RepID=A0A1Y1QPU6_9GAMM|nr:MAG: hypothetical protein BWK73_19940 [Thiothrix lacustris]
MRILIIDDHPLFREVLRQYVEDSYPDARIFEAGSVQEAMAVLVEYAGFGLITLDVSLPEMDGIAGLALIRAMLPVIPVMMMSGVNDTNMAHLAMIDKTAYIAKLEAEGVYQILLSPRRFGKSLLLSSLWYYVTP